MVSQNWKRVFIAFPPWHHLSGTNNWIGWSMHIILSLVLPQVFFSSSMSMFTTHPSPSAMPLIRRCSRTWADTHQCLSGIQPWIKWWLINSALKGSPTKLASELDCPAKVLALRIILLASSDIMWLLTRASCSIVCRSTFTYCTFVLQM